MNPTLAFIGGGGAGGVVIFFILLYLLLWALALIGAPILIFLAVRAFRRANRRRGKVFVAIACLFIALAPSLTYYIQHTFEKANKAIHEQAVRDAAIREQQLREVEARERALKQ